MTLHGVKDAMHLQGTFPTLGNSHIEGVCETLSFDCILCLQSPTLDQLALISVGGVNSCNVLTNRF